MYPNKVLRVKTPKIEVADGNLTKELDSLAETLMTKDLGAGLAAPQVGLERRFFGLKNKEQKRVNFYINPTIMATYGEKFFPQLVGADGKTEDFLEGCLSFPDLWGTVKRWLKVDVVWQELEGGLLVDKQKTLSGFEAIVFQHELDHLDGVLFIDHIKEDGGKFFEWREGGKKKIRSVDEVIKKEKS